MQSNKTEWNIYHIDGEVLQGSCREKKVTYSDVRDIQIVEWGEESLSYIRLESEYYLIGMLKLFNIVFC